MARRHVLADDFDQRNATLWLRWIVHFDARQMRGVTWREGAKLRCEEVPCLCCICARVKLCVSTQRRYSIFCHRPSRSCVSVLAIKQTSRSFARVACLRPPWLTALHSCRAEGSEASKRIF